MTVEEFDEFARLWQGGDNAEEERIFRQLAWRVGIKARALKFADWGLAALIVIAAIVAMASDTTPATLLFGLLLGAAAVWATWKRRTLHQGSLLAGMNHRETLIGAARERGRLELRQAQWGLLLFPLGILLAGVMKFSALTGGHVERFWATMAEGVMLGKSPLLALLVLILGECYFLYRSYRLRGELRRLDRLSEQYRHESLLDDADAADAH